MTIPSPRLLPAGDTALTIEIGDGAGLVQSSRIVALARRVESAAIDGVLEVVPAIRSLTVHFDPLRLPARRLRELLSPWAGEIAAAFPDAGSENGDGPDAALTSAGRRWLIPACYTTRHAPDIESVARHCRLDPWQVGALHACVAYRVFMVGFLPGHPYMGDLPPPLRVPRRDTPRTNVPAGSVAIATTMSVIYPLESPGGWHILARTPVRLFDPAWPQPSLLAPGDEVRFEPIGEARFDDAADAARGWKLEPLSP